APGGAMDATVANSAREGLVGVHCSSSLSSLAAETAVAADVAKGAVEKGGVGLVVIALHRLKVVALELPLGDVNVFNGHRGPFETGERRLLFGRAHVAPDELAGLHAGVGLDPDLVFERQAFGGVWEVDAFPGDVELPAVIDAAEAALFIAAKEH